jgi:hypothetical protein
MSTMKKTILASTLLLAFFVRFAFAGDNLDFTLVNKTGYDIKSIYVDESASDKWSDDILKGQGPLKNGETFKVEFSPEETSAKWDLKVIYTDGEVATWTGAKLGEISKINLFWSKDKGSSATTE